ncbi:MAG: hypothetical protein GX946_07875 [Oligosphaeraceae bacterium]|nr:hypothetical protein [Oligosphaeraceae bacterium]
MGENFFPPVSRLDSGRFLLAAAVRDMLSTNQYGREEIEVALKKEESAIAAGTGEELSHAKTPWMGNRKPVFPDATIS